MLKTNLLEAAEEVGKLFGYPDYKEGSDDIKFEVREERWKGHKALVVSVGAMYDVPSYEGEGGIIGMLTGIQNALGGNRIDEFGKERMSGCETCDYGSFYADEFVVWEE